MTTNHMDALITWPKKCTKSRKGPREKNYWCLKSTDVGKGSTDVWTRRADILSWLIIVSTIASTGSWESISRSSDWKALMGRVPGSCAFKFVSAGSALCPRSPGLVLHADLTATDEVARGVLHCLWFWFTVVVHKQRWWGWMCMIRWTFYHTVYRLIVQKCYTHAHTETKNCFCYLTIIFILPT